jgi:N-acetylglucosamine-6-phosphate deacetylase
VTVRLGAAAALIDGQRVEGDVAIDPATGRIAAVGLSSPHGRGLAVPGLLDLQVNGIGPVDLRTCDPEGYAEAAQQLAAAGATAVQPTLHSAELQHYERALGVLAEVHAHPPPGCRWLPAHLEGPFLSPRWAGAHDPAHLLDPDPIVLDRLLAAGPVGFVTLAPELPGTPELIAAAIARGVRVSIGHSDADAEVTRAAVAAGARHLTHCWNAHRRMSARDPGPAGVALADPTVTIGLVGDLVHVAAEVVRLTFAAAPGRVAVTTDSVAVPADAAVTVRDGAARRPDGTIAGGVARPDDCLRNLVSVGVSLPDAVHACGGVQRRRLGLPEVQLRPGDPADVAVLDDGLRPIRTVVGGVEQWCS